MVKRLFQLFIVLFVLFAGSNIHASSVVTYNGKTGSTNVKNEKTILDNNTPGYLKITQNIVTAHPFVLMQQDKIDNLHESDDETDKTVYLKKCQDFTKYYLSTYCTRAPVHARQNKLSGFSNHQFPAHYSSARKYIIFRVIRL